jgi:1-acyl-sn-glycerol-3-phosphate acyltransferase
MEIPFSSNDSYDTSPNTPRRILDRLSLGTRTYFMASFISVVLHSRKLALQGLYDTKAWIASSFDVFKIIERCGGRFHISGLSNIRKFPGPVVFVSNHMSTLETLVFPCLIAPFKEVVFVIKDSLVKQRYFGPIARARNPIVIGRKNSREDLVTVINKGQEHLSKGTSIIIFPQSTRTKELDPEHFNTLGVKLAAKAGVPVVPVAIKTDFWENGKHWRDLGPIKRKRPIYMEFAEPLTIHGTGKDEHTKIIDFISSRLTEWQKD